MARIAGVELPKNKRMDIALTYIYGIGRPSALKILKTANVDPAIKTDDLSADQQVHIRQAIDTELRKHLGLIRPELVAAEAQLAAAPSPIPKAAPARR